MADGPPLSTLLSQVLVAFTIEFDNEFERQMPHRTTNHGSTAGSRPVPWLVSLVMWSNCMKFVGEGGVSVRELEDLARTKTNLNGMQRWGYIVVAGNLVRATPAGRKAQEVWRPLFETIEKRWQERFGKDEIGQLRKSLLALVGRMKLDLPDCLPILGYGLFSRGPVHPRPAQAIDSSLPLCALLSRSLLAFALEFERESELSLALSANVVRVLDEKGVRVRDLPLLTGVSKEAIDVALGFLQKKRAAAVEPEKIGSRTKLARLTPQGRAAQQEYHRLLGTIEKRWQTDFGKDTIHALRESLEHLAGRSLLFHGLQPNPGGWRASVRKPNALPHYPMVLHRGGFPDGS
jgi:DNA-binding MarR family transcriptional regulator